MQKQKLHYVVITGEDGKSELFRMKEWLRQNPTFVPAGLVVQNTSHMLRNGLKKNGWKMEEKADKVLLYKPDSVAGINEKQLTETNTPKEDQNYWFVGASYGGTNDQTPRFYAEGIWENGWDDRFLEEVKSMKTGEHIAIKSSYTRKNDLPFNNHGESVSVIRIKATGIIQENSGDGKRVKVKWTPLKTRREWYFYTQRGTIWGVKRGDWMADALIDFTFNAQEQDINRFLSDPYWTKKYKFTPPKIQTEGSNTSSLKTADTTKTHENPYSLSDIINDGCFIEHFKLESYIKRLSTKKNIILQGPPGTGKTWLAERLAYAFVGYKDIKRVRSIQFHPNLSYEDFVRGWRPTGEGKLSLVDGPFIEMIKTAQNDQSSKFVIVIEEINRGNTAQIFGEMLTLLEPDRRSPDCALELCYKRDNEGRTYIPNNLYVIGTMNIADRSLALVDFALRRRFAFIELEPNFGKAWQDWLMSKCGMNSKTISSIEKRMLALNEVIKEEASLGKQFCIGHSFVTPTHADQVGNPHEWFLSVVETEIGPLLDEYWFDSREKAAKAKQQLIENF